MRNSRNYRMFVIELLAVVLLAAHGVSTTLAQDGSSPLKPKPAKEESKRRFGNVTEREVKIFQLKNMHASQAAHMVSEIWRDVDLRISSDERSNSVIISGNEKLLNSVEALLLRLDDAPHASPSRPDSDSHDVLIRVVWLVDERLIEGETTAVPPDLEPTVQKLREKFGLGTLATAGQIVINERVTDEQDFRASGTASVQGSSEFHAGVRIKVIATNKADLEVLVQTGPVRVIEVGGSHRAIEASDATRKFKKPMCELGSKLSVTIGKPVFFGMAPVESKTSLFVIQVLEAHEVTEDIPHDPNK